MRGVVLRAPGGEGEARRRGAPGRRGNDKELGRGRREARGLGALTRGGACWERGWQGAASCRANEPLRRRWVGSGALWFSATPPLCPWASRSGADGLEIPNARA